MVKVLLNLCLSVPTAPVIAFAPLVPGWEAGGCQLSSQISVPAGVYFFAAVSSWADAFLESVTDFVVWFIRLHSLWLFMHALGQ